MPLKIGFVMDPLESINMDKDTTAVLMQDAQARGHEVWYIEMPDLFYDRGRTMAYCSRVELTPKSDPCYITTGTDIVHLEELDCVWMRKDPPFNLDYIYATYLLSFVDPSRCFVINNPAGIRKSNEKLYTLHYPDIIPPSFVTKDKQLIKDFMTSVGGEIVIKPLDSCGGEGVFALREGERNVNVVIETATAGGTVFVMAQKFLAEVAEGDKRVLVLDGEPIGAVLRVAGEDDFRCNFHAGGSPAPTSITERDKHICSRLAPRLMEDGLFFVGIDIIGGNLTEVNTTSPTGVQEINRNLGIKLESKITDFVEEMCNRH